MTAVRLTQDIRFDVLSNLDKKSNELINKKTKELDAKNIGYWALKERIPERAFEFIRNLEESTGGLSWVAKSSSVMVRVKFKVDETAHDEVIASSMVAKTYMPYSFIHPNTTTLYLKETSPIYLEVAKILETKQRLIDSKVLIKDEIYSKVLAQCTTINQAVELWPTIVNYLPENALRKYHNQDAPKRKPKKINTPPLSDEVKVALIRIGIAS